MNSCELNQLPGRHLDHKEDSNIHQGLPVFITTCQERPPCTQGRSSEEVTATNHIRMVVKSFLLLGLSCFAASFLAQPAAADTVNVNNSRALLDAFRNTSVDLILLANNVTLDPAIWTIGAVRLDR